MKRKRQPGPECTCEYPWRDSQPPSASIIDRAKRIPRPDCPRHGERQPETGKMVPVSDPPPEPHDAEPVAALTDAQLATVPLEDLRTAYRELRDRHAAVIAKISEQTTAALGRLKEQGKKTGGDNPFGYRASADGTLRKVPSEQKVISFAKGRHERGLSFYAIARELNEHQQLRVHARGSKKNKDGKVRFWPAQVKRMVEGHHGG